MKFLNINNKTLIVRLLFLIISFIKIQNLHSQNEINFKKQFNAPNSLSLDIGRKVLQTPDDNYYFIGNKVKHQVYLREWSYITKINKHGSLIFSKDMDLGLGSHNSLNRSSGLTDIKLLNSGNILLGIGAFYKRSENVSNYEMAIVNANCNVLQNNIRFNYQNVKGGTCNSVLESKNTNGIIDGVIGCGTFYMNINSSVTRRIVVTKYSQANNNVLWANMYNLGGTNEAGEAICQTEDGGYVIVGKSDNKIAILKLDNAGNYIWCKKIAINTTSESIGFRVINYFDGSNYKIIVGGHTKTGSVTNSNIIKLSSAGVIEDFISTNFSSGTNKLNSIETYSLNNIYISGINEISGNSFNAILDLTTMSNAIVPSETDACMHSIVTSDGGFASVGEGGNNDRLILKMKSDGLVNCNGNEMELDYINQTYTEENIDVPSPISINHTSGTFPITNEDLSTNVSCCYALNAQRNSTNVNFKCKEVIYLSRTCEPRPSETASNWYDESGNIIGNGSNYSFESDVDRTITFKAINIDGCVLCEQIFNVKLSKPEICISLPEIICINQPIKPNFNCDMSNISWHQWVIHQRDGDWSTRVELAKFAFSGSPDVNLDIKSLWNGFMPGKCYNISLDVVDLCGKSNTLFLYFCIPDVKRSNKEITFCKSAGENVGIWNPCSYLNLPLFNIVNTSNIDNKFIEYNSEQGFVFDGILYQGCIDWTFYEGQNYEIEYFDENGCLIEILSINVTGKLFEQDIECIEHKNILCNEEFDIMTFNPTCSNCNLNSPNTTFTNWTISNLISGELVYEREIIDKENCRRCKYKLIVHKIAQEVNYKYEIQNCIDIDLKSLSPCFNNLVYPYQITHYSSNNSNPESIDGTLIRLCCESNNDGNIEENMMGINHYYDILMPDGCICRIKINIKCQEEQDAVPNHEILTIKSIDEARITFSPNPVLDYLKVEFNFPKFDEEQFVIVYDIEGKLIKKIKINSTATQIDLSDIDSGLYIIKVTDKDKVIKYEKIIVQHL